MIAALDSGWAVQVGVLHLSIFRILIVDDHPIVLTGLQLLFAGNERFKIVGEACSAPGGSRQAERLQPDAIITDLVMGESDGIVLIEDLRAALPASRIVVYSSRDERVWGPRAVRAGAHGYVAKSEPLEVVAGALERVMMGHIFLSEQVQQLMIDDIAQRHLYRTDIDGLSPRELQVLEMIGGGGTLQSMASRMQLSVKTVGTYRERLKIKLGLDSVRTLERYAVEHIGARRDLA
jgi:two-component system response regulator NreC